jgi:hypothetical protein
MSSTSFPPEGAHPQVFSTGGTIPAPGSGQQLAISNGALLAAVIFLFMVIIFVFLLYLYAKRYLGASPMFGRAMSSRFLFVDASPVATRGLPAAALPVAVYSKQEWSSPSDGGGKGEALECAVCLAEVADGEKVRALPKCGHGFHVECIDMWFHSHDTCPLCRAPGGAADAEALPRVPSEEPALEFPTNVLFWGTHDEVTDAVPSPPAPTITAASTSSSASVRRKENLVIDIPSRPVALNAPLTSSSPSTPLPASRMPVADEMRSPASARLRSLRRLLSRGTQAVVGTSYSPRSATGDIEQGFAGADGARPPKTPPSTN